MSELPDLDVDYFTTYEGVVEDGEKKVRRKEGGQNIGTKLRPATELSAGAQDRFEWGYIGGGVMTTAVTVLEDAYDAETAQEYGNEFMHEFLSGAAEEWSLEAREIEDYLTE